MTLTHPRKILLVVLQIGEGERGKAKDLSAPLPKPQRDHNSDLNWWIRPNPLRV
jgi:hypothetical protein